MIVREFHKLRQDNVLLYKTYSDKGLYIRKVDTNEEYEIAIDIENSTNVYEETDKPIESREEI